MKKRWFALIAACLLLLAGATAWWGWLRGSKLEGDARHGAHEGSAAALPRASATELDALERELKKTKRFY